MTAASFPRARASLTSSTGVRLTAAHHPLLQFVRSICNARSNWHHLAPSWVAEIGIAGRVVLEADELEALPSSTSPARATVDDRVNGVSSAP